MFFSVTFYFQSYICLLSVIASAYKQIYLNLFCKPFYVFLWFIICRRVFLTYRRIDNFEICCIYTAEWHHCVILTINTLFLLLSGSTSCSSIKIYKSLKNIHKTHHMFIFIVISEWNYYTSKSNLLSQRIWKLFLFSD